MHPPGSVHCPDSLRLINARFIDVATGAALPASTSITLNGGRIVDIAPADTGAQGQSGQAGNVVETVDLGGRSVIPGLMNSHCHLTTSVASLLVTPGGVAAQLKYGEAQRLKTLENCLDRGITYVRDAMSDDLRINRSAHPDINGVPVGPRVQQCIVVSQPHAYMSEERSWMARQIGRRLGLGGLPFTSPHSGIVVFDRNAGEAAVRDAVDRAIDERGADSIKIGEQSMSLRSFKNELTFMEPAQFRALVEQAHERGRPTTAHQTSVATFRRVLGEFNLGEKDHRPGAAMVSMAHLARDGYLSGADVEAFIAADCTIEPTLSVSYAMAWGLPGDPLASSAEISALHEFRRNRFSRARIAENYWLPQLQRHYLRGAAALEGGNYRALGLVDLRPLFAAYSPIMNFGAANLSRLFQAGARIGLANDGGIPHLTAAMLDLEIAMLELVLNGDSATENPQRKSFDGAEALRMGTINNAVAMGISKDYGSLEVGKVADLVILDGDPVEDIALIGAPAAAVFMDGQLIRNGCGLERQNLA